MHDLLPGVKFPDTYSTGASAVGTNGLKREKDSEKST